MSLVKYRRETLRDKNERLGVTNEELKEAIKTVNKVEPKKVKKTK